MFFSSLSLSLSHMAWCIVYLYVRVWAHIDASVCVWACILLLVFWCRVSFACVVSYISFAHSLALFLCVCICMMCIQSVSIADILLLQMSLTVSMWNDSTSKKRANVTSPLAVNLRTQLTFHFNFYIFFLSFWIDKIR